MNDFTKEELQEIKCWGESYWLTIISIKAEKLEPNIIPFIEKIQSMIDNYCEHEWNYYCCDCSMDSISCIKCRIYADGTYE